MKQPDLLNITTDAVHLPFFKEKDVLVDILRLDKIHPLVSGNKWFKLKYHIENFYKGNYNGIITFGGAWSNHIVATACYCKLKNITAIGIIRGERPVKFSSALEKAEEYGILLNFISREDYKRKNEPEFLKILNDEYADYYIIPEGGAGPAGEKGAGEILNLLTKNDYSHIVCAIGTSTMYNGIFKARNKDQVVIGIPVLKGMRKNEMKNSNRIITDYHFGGYAKYTSELISFINDFYGHTTVPTDFVYTGKLCFAVADLIKKDFFPKGGKILIIHSGGLQGNNSLPPGMLIF